MNDPVRASYLVSGPSRERVFAALLDVRRFPEWSFGLRGVRLLNGAEDLRPGARMEFSLSAVGMTHAVVTTVTTVEEPSRISWRYSAGAVGEGGWSLEEAGPGTVRMTLYTDYQVEPAWLNRVAHRPFFRGVVQDLLRRSMRSFAKRLEES